MTAEPQSLVHALASWAAQSPREPALHEKTADGWRTWTWADYWQDVRDIAKGLVSLGHQPGERVIIIGKNRVDWVLCELGIMAARGIPAPIYTTNTDEQVAYIVNHSRAKLAICDETEQLEKFERCADSGEISLETVITMDHLGDRGERVMSLDRLRQLGREQDDAELDARVDAITTDDTALLIYTSGTTGKPKAVMLHFGGIRAMGKILRGFVDDALEYCEVDEAYRLVSYLPLCHAAEQMTSVFTHFELGGEITFCPEITQLKDYLVAVRPTALLAVPRVWEKFQAALQARFAEATGLKARLLRWAMRTELAGFARDVESGERHAGLQRRFANKLVLDKIKEQLGLDRLLVASSGAAPIGPGTLEFFASIGVPIYEGYGMTETSGAATIQQFGRPRFGTVGRAAHGVELRIAEDGELLIRGPIITRGYLDDPKKTAELLDGDGWLHTGDLASIDEDGYVRITGRKKDIIITAGGKNVAPAEMEAHLQRIPGVGQAVVVGDRQPYLTALITLDPEALPELASRIGASAADLGSLATHPALEDYLRPRVETDCNAKVARYQTIKKFKVLPVEFSVEGGELTPTMKVRRNIIAEKYGEDIQALYD